ncbi:hypothetical protein [Bifidobacterium jacchi]|uniref:hypothetical protein n=1 Tax=Bifidobacterium jacchi TaxID=2490545 RepID=UPI00125EA371|nr:hypothetical protein [Bifidobacterium jacchi]
MIPAALWQYCSGISAVSQPAVSQRHPSGIQTVAGIVDANRAHFAMRARICAAAALRIFSLA